MYFFDNPEILLMVLIANPSTSITKEYGPIIGAIIGSTLSFLYVCHTANKTKDREKKENQSKVSKALISELNYIKYTTNHSLLFCEGFFYNKPNEIITPEILNETQSDFDRLNGILRTLKESRTTSIEYAIMFKNINKELFILYSSDCQEIIDTYYFIEEKYSMLNNILKSEYSSPLELRQIVNFNIIITSYLKDLKDILGKIDKINGSLKKYVIE